MPQFTFGIRPPPGINSDDTAFSAKGQWADGNNVRPRNGSMQVLGSYTPVASLAAGQAITGLTVMLNPLGSATAIAGTLNKLWALDGLGAPVDVTPGGGAVGSINWSFASYGGALLCNPYQGSIYKFTMGGGAATALSGAPAEVVTILVSRRQVLAFGCNEEASAIFNPRCIRGSDLEDPTDWVTSSSNNAFEEILSDPGIIVTARLIGDYVAVWTSSSLWMGQFIGDPGQTYRWERIDGAPGAAGTEPACVLGQTAYWFAPDLQVWTWSPGAVPVPVPCPISKEFTTNMSGTAGLRIAVIPHYNEIWVTFADDRDAQGDPSRYIAFNQQGQWFRGRLDRMLICSSGEAGGEIRRIYDSHAAAAFLAVSTTGNQIYAHELSADMIGATAPSWSLQSADQYVDEARRRVETQRVVPDFEDQAGDVSLTLYFRSRPQATAVTKGPYILAKSAAKKDFRASGMIVSVKFSGSAYVRLGKPTFDCVTLGER